MFKIRNFYQERPLWLFAPGVKKRNYTTGDTRTVFLTNMSRVIGF